MTQFSFFKNKSYSASEKNIIQYLTNYSNFNDLTIGKLAEKTNTSNATIIRLSKKSGFTGFSELKIALIKEQEANKYITQNVNFNFPFNPGNSLIQIENSMANLYSNSISKLHSSLDISALLQLAIRIIRSKRVFIFAKGDTGLTAQSFINKINKLGIYPVFASANGEANNNWKNIQKDDLAILITYENKDTELPDEGTNTIRTNGGRIAIISSNITHDDKRFADYLVSIPPEEGSHKLATFYSQFAFEYVLNILFSIIYRESVLGN